jgi:hypothetical protein
MEVFMSDREFSDIQIFQHSGKEIPLFMTGHKNCLQTDYLLGPGPRPIKKELTEPRSRKVEKHCSRLSAVIPQIAVKVAVPPIFLAFCLTSIVIRSFLGYLNCWQT